MNIILENNKNAGGIYQIRNIINGRVYIGSTSRFQQRAREHLRMLRRGKATPFLQNDWNICGSEAFEFFILEVVIGDNKKRIEIEQEYINKYYDEKCNCYNINRLASSRKGTKNNWSEEQRAKCSEERKNRWKNKDYVAKQKAIAKKIYEENKEEIEKNLAKGRVMHLGVRKPKEQVDKQIETKKRLQLPGSFKGKKHKKETKEILSKSKQKTYDVTVSDPNGIIYGPITNLKQFCLQHNLNQGCMWMVIVGKKKSTKGWKVFSTH